MVYGTLNYLPLFEHLQNVLHEIEYPEQMEEV